MSHEPMLVADGLRVGYECNESVPKVEKILPEWMREPVDGPQSPATGPGLRARP